MSKSDITMGGTMVVKNVPRIRSVLFVGGIHDGKTLPVMGKLMETYTALTPQGNIEYNLMNIHLQGYDHKVYFYRQHGTPDLISLLLNSYTNGHNTAETGAQTRQRAPSVV